MGMSRAWSSERQPNQPDFHALVLGYPDLWRHHCGPVSRQVDDHHVELHRLHDRIAAADSILSIRRKCLPRRGRRPSARDALHRHRDRRHQGQRRLVASGAVHGHQGSDYDDGRRREDHHRSQGHDPEASDSHSHQPSSHTTQQN